MSYQGYCRMLCKNGHLAECDAYDLVPLTKCECGAAFVWWESVDTTNDEGHPTKLVEVGGDVKPCPCCGGTGNRLMTRYAIPEKEKP